MRESKKIRCEVLDDTQFVCSKKSAIFTIGILVFCNLAMGFASVLFLEAKEAEILILEKTQVGMTEDIIKLEMECDY